MERHETLTQILLHVVSDPMAVEGERVADEEATSAERADEAGECLDALFGGDGIGGDLSPNLRLCREPLVEGASVRGGALGRVVD